MDLIYPKNEAKKSRATVHFTKADPFCTLPIILQYQCDEIHTAPLNILGPIRMKSIIHLVLIEQDRWRCLIKYVGFLLQSVSKHSSSSSHLYQMGAKLITLPPLP
jgi:hypothetical protein